MSPAMLPLSTQLFIARLNSKTILTTGVLLNNLNLPLCEIKYNLLPKECQIALILQDSLVICLKMPGTGTESVTRQPLCARGLNGSLTNV